MGLQLYLLSTRKYHAKNDRRLLRSLTLFNCELKPFSTLHQTPPAVQHVLLTSHASALPFKLETPLNSQTRVCEWDRIFEVGNDAAVRFILPFRKK